MKKFGKIVFAVSSFSISSVLQIIIFAAANIIIFAISYILGYRYLIGNTLAGNDSLNFFTIVNWIHKFYPQVPFWFSVQGGGVSFTGYPWFAAYLVNTIDYFTKLDLVQAYRLLGFLSVPLTAVGIFVFAWSRLTDVKPVWLRQIIGLIASLFYVVAPVSWIWLVRWGFYAEQVSIIFVPWLLLFFDLFIDHLFAKKYDFLFRVGFVFAPIFWVLAFLTHFFAGVAVIPIFIGMIGIKFVFQRENRLQLIKRLVIPLVLFSLVFFGLFIFRFYSYHTYNKAVASGGFTGYGSVAQDRKGADTQNLTSKMMLSLEDPGDPIKDWRNSIRDMRFPFYVWVLVIPSLLLAIFTSRKVFIFSLFTLLGLLLSTNVDFFIFTVTVPILSKIPVLNQFPGWLSGRGFFVVSRIYTPLAAAYGAYIIWEIIWRVILMPVKKYTHKAFFYSLIPFKVGSVLALTILSVSYLVLRFYNLPAPQKYYINAGAFPRKFYIDQKYANETDPNIYFAHAKLSPSTLLFDIWGKGNTFNDNSQYGLYLYIKDKPEYEGYDMIADFNLLNTICSDKDNKFSANDICAFYINKKFSTEKPLPPRALVAAAQKLCSDPLKRVRKEYAYCQAFYPSIYEQLAITNWPVFEVSNDIRGDLESAQGFFKEFPKNNEYRYDISSFAGKTIMAAAVVNENSMLQVYMGSLSLIYNTWNYNTQMMYTQFPLYQKPGVLTELGKWFGFNFVYLAGSSIEPTQFWNEDLNWSKKNKDESGNRYFKNPTTLTTWDTRPRMLVISDNEKQFYDQTFKFFTRGGLLYEQAIPVQGKKEVDSYSYDELKQYDMIFMRGYSYKWRWNAYRLLDKYVKNGGKLIFDTGWQYYVPDYKISSAPSFMPFESLDWKNLATDENYKIEDEVIAEDIDPARLGNLVWENASWGVSAPGKLRDWGKPVLSYDGKPLAVVGQYGKGKVAWFGFNIIPHSESKDSMEEVKLFNNIVNYLQGDDKSLNNFNLQKKRISPDEIKFTLSDSVGSASNLYYRESYYPDWKASLLRSDGSKKSIKITRAGPGFMLLQLPPVNKGESIILAIKPSIRQRIATITSISTIVLLFVYLISPAILSLAVNFFLRKAKKVKNISKSLTEHAKLKKVKLPLGLGDREEDNY